MSDNLREQIRKTMELKEADELLDIWQANNRLEWSDETFDVIKDILISRREEIPEQDEPVYEIEEDDGLDDDLEGWEVRALDADNQPEFYNVVDVILINKRINVTAKAAIVVYLLVGLTTIPFYAYYVTRFFRGQEFVLVSYVIAFVISMLSAAFSVAVLYFPLKALTHILRILMEMEFRSRKAN